MTITFRTPQAEDAEALADTARRSFLETFGGLYRPEDLDPFVEEKFGPAGLPAEIGDPRYTIRIACDGARIVGFAKTGAVVLPSPAPRDGTLELHQLYVLREWHGKGVAAGLMDWTIDRARTLGCRSVCLGVYSGNARAQRFYARNGFVEIGRYDYPVGEHVDDERIWLLRL